MNNHHIIAPDAAAHTQAALPTEVDAILATSQEYRIYLLSELFRGWLERQRG